MLIKEIPETDKSIMRALIMEVFDQFVAPDYSTKGVASFRDFVMNDDMLTGYICYGAYEGNFLQGILVADDIQGHVVLYFVRAEAQGRGIGRTLWNIFWRTAFAQRTRSMLHYMQRRFMSVWDLR